MKSFDIPLALQKVLMIPRRPITMITKISNQAVIIVKTADVHDLCQESVVAEIKAQRRMFEAGVFIQFDVEFKNVSKTLFIMQTFIDPAQNENLLRLLANAAYCHVLVFGFDMNLKCTKCIRSPSKMRNWTSWTPVQEITVMNDLVAKLF